MTRMRYIAPRRRGRGARCRWGCLGGQWQLDDHNTEHDHTEHDGAEHSAARRELPRRGVDSRLLRPKQFIKNASMSSL